VIDEMFAGELDSAAVLNKYGVSRNLYNKWLGDEAFVDEFERRTASAALAGRALIARYVIAAAAKLVSLTDSKNPETARKACLDIINLPAAAYNVKQQPQADSAGPVSPAEISAELAERLLAELARPADSV